MRPARRRSRSVNSSFLTESLEQRVLLAANLLVNGGFDNEPNIADSVQNYGVNGGDPGFSLLTGSQIPGWTIASGHGVTVHIASANRYPVISGPFGVNTDGEGYNSHNADLYQDVATTDGTNYKLTFDWQGWMSGGAATKIDVSLTDTKTNKVLADNTYGWDTSLHHESVPFTGTGNSVRLEIKENPETGTNDNGYNIDNFVVTSGGANLLIRPQPKDTSPGDPINQGSGVRVALVDEKGRTDTTAKDTLSVSLTSTNGASGTLTGTLTKPTTRGVATFTNLSVNKPGQYVLNITDTEGDVVTSQTFTVSTGKLIFKQKIKGGAPGNPLQPAIEVDLVDKKGKKITDASTTVTLNISSNNSSNPITGNTAQIVKGVAVFNKLTFAKPGDYTLTASDDEGDAGSTSNEFSVTGFHLAFKMQPTEVGVKSPLKYKIELEDSRNRLVNNSHLGLGLALNTVDGGQNAALSGLADIFNFGIADNTSSPPVSINAAGTYTITFTPISESSDSFDTTIDPITSAPFKVVANHLVFSQEPGTAVAGQPLHYKVALEDYRNRVVTTNSSDQVRFTLVPPTNGATLAFGIETLINGIADNARATVSIDSAGSYTLQVTDVPADPSTAAATSVTSKSFRVRGSK